MSLKEGADLLGRGQPAAALTKLLTAVEADPQDWQARCYLGVARLQCGQTDPSLLDFQVATQLAPNEPLVHFNLARALYSLGHLDDAREAVKKTLELDSLHSQGRQFLQHLEVAVHLTACPEGQRGLVPYVAAEVLAGQASGGRLRKAGRGLFWGALYGQWGTLATAALGLLGGRFDSEYLLGIFFISMVGSLVFAVWGAFLGLIIALSGKTSASGGGYGILAGLALWGVFCLLADSGSLFFAFLILGSRVGSALGKRLLPQTEAV